MRYHSLDFWRGVACLMVVVFHSTIYADHHGGGPLIVATRHFNLGVPIFFVISGYCIAAAAESCARKRQSAVVYFWRRFRRIYPPYWIVVGIFAVIVAVLDLVIPRIFSDDPHPIPRPWWLPWPAVLGNLTLTESWRHHVFGTPLKYFLSPAWSLCYEEQFYAVLGLILAVAPKRLWQVSAVVTAAVAGLVASGYAARCQGFFFDGLWLQFAAGMLVCVAVNRSRQLWSIAILGPALVWQWADPRMVTAFGFAVGLILLHPCDRLLADSPWTWPVTFCGTMCYSLYLVHWPFCKAISHLAWLGGLHSDAATLLVTVPACLAVSVAASRAFHVLVERRFLNSPVTSERPLPTIGAAVAVQTAT